MRLCIYVCVCHTALLEQCATKCMSNVSMKDVTLAFAVSRGFVLSLSFPVSFYHAHLFHAGNLRVD